MASFEEAIRGGSLILTDGGIETRVMFETEVVLPAYVQVAALVGDPVGGRCCAGSTRAMSLLPVSSSCQ